MRLSGWGYYLRSIPTLLRNFRPLSTVIPLFLGKQPSKPVEVRVRGVGLCFRVRTAMDVWVIKETCLDRFYERLTPLQDGWTIIDIGAGLGDFAVDAALRCPSSRILAFEPFPESFRLLQENLGLNRVGNVETCRSAVTGRQGKARLSLSSESVMQHSTAMSGSETIPVETVTLQEVFDQKRQDHCDFLKIDVEGGEYEILLGANSGLLSRVERIAMECHDNTTAGKHQEIVRHLEQSGFRVWVCPSPVHSNLGYLYARRD